MIFWLGYTIMFFNEGFVIMRHVSPWFANKRKKLHEKFGREKVKRIHGFTDWTWIILIAIGTYLEYENWKLYASVVLGFWLIVAVGVYLPMLIRKLMKKETGYVK
mgnify:FL=1